MWILGNLEMMKALEKCTIKDKNFEDHMMSSCPKTRVRILFVKGIDRLTADEMTKAHQNKHKIKPQTGRESVREPINGKQSKTGEP